MLNLELEYNFYMDIPNYALLKIFLFWIVESQWIS